MGFFPLKQYSLIVEGDSLVTCKNNTDSNTSWRKVESSNMGLFCFKTQLDVLQYSSDANHSELMLDFAN